MHGQSHLEATSGRLRQMGLRFSSGLEMELVDDIRRTCMTILVHTLRQCEDLGNSTRRQLWTRLSTSLAIPQGHTCKSLNVKLCATTQSQNDGRESEGDREREKEKGSVYAKGCWLTYEQAVIPAFDLEVENFFIFLVLFYCCVLRVPGRLT